MDEITYFCCHLDGTRDEPKQAPVHDEQLFALVLDASPDGETHMCTRHVGEHLNLDGETTIYPIPRKGRTS